jgi:hypothetical protein
MQSSGWGAILKGEKNPGPEVEAKVNRKSLLLPPVPD